MEGPFDRESPVLLPINSTPAFAGIPLISVLVHEPQDVTHGGLARLGHPQVEAAATGERKAEAQPAGHTERSVRGEDYAKR